MKNIFLLALCATAFGCYSFTQIDASIIGSWTQTEMVTITKHRGTSSGDTTISHDRGFAISFTADSHYHYTAPYGHKADGTYKINDDMLTEVSNNKISSTSYKIVLLTDHKMILLGTYGEEKGHPSSSTFTYTR